MNLPEILGNLHFPAKKFSSMFSKQEICQIARCLRSGREKKRIVIGKHWCWLVAKAIFIVSD